MGAWRLDVLGGFLLRHGDDTVAVSSTAARQLLGWLALTRRPQTRDRVVGALWGDLDEVRARRQLSQTLWRLRVDGDGHSPVVATPMDIQLDPTVTVDLDGFDGYVPSAGPARIERLRELVPAYGGPFLDGLYDDWVVEAREDLERRYVAMLRELFSSLRATGRLTDALDAARRWASTRPLEEEAHQAVIVTCALLGRVADGLAQYETCRAVLATELGVEPGAETVALLAQLSSDDADEPAPEPVRRLVGRRGERAQLLALLDQVADGHGQVVFIEGDVGIGKTTLLERFAEDAMWRGAVVARGTGRLPSRPFGVIQEAVGSVLTPLIGAGLVDRLEPAVVADLAALAPALRSWYPDAIGAQRLSGSAGRERMIDALSSAVIALADLQPTVVIIDDLCLAEPDSLCVLIDLAGRVSEAALLVCLAYRPDRMRQSEAHWRALRDIHVSSDPPRLELLALPPRDSAAVLDGLGIDLTPDATHTVLEAAAGNPLQIEELARAAAGGGLGAATGLRAAIEQRLAAVAGEDRSVLDALAVAGEPVALATLATLSGLSLGTAAASVARLERIGLVALNRELASTPNEPVATAAYDTIGTARRRELHARTLAVLRDRGRDDVELLAHHASSAELWADAAAYLRQAGENAAALHAYDTAAARFAAGRDAAHRGAAAPGEVVAILTGLVTALDVLGQRAKQEDALDALEQACLAADEPLTTVLMRRVDLLTRTDRLIDARKVSQRLAVIARATNRPLDRALAHLALGQTQALTGRPAAAARTLATALTDADALPDTALEVRARLVHSLAVAEYQLGHLGAAIERAHEAAELLGQVGDHATSLEAMVLGAYGTFERGDANAALEALQRALDAAKDIGYLHGAGVAAINLANVMSLTGRPVAALSHYRDAATLLRRSGYRAGELAATLNGISASQVALGPATVSAAELNDAVGWFDTNAPGRYQVLARGVLAEHHLLRGAPGAAGDSLAEAAALAGRLSDRALQLEILALQLERDRQDGDWPNVNAGHARAVRLARELGIPVAPEIDVLGALAAAHLGAPNRCLELVESARGPRWRRPVVRLRGAEAAALLGREDLVRELVTAGAADMRVALADATDAQVSAAMTDLAAYETLTEWSRRFEPQLIRRAVPAASAPTGRPLAGHELVEVDLRVSVPADLDITDAAEARRARMRRMIDDARSQGGELRVDDLAELLAVGTATVKRDLRLLRAGGAHVRTRGTRSDDPKVRDNEQTADCEDARSHPVRAASSRSGDPEVRR